MSPRHPDAFQVHQASMSQPTTRVSSPLAETFMGVPASPVTSRLLATHDWARTPLGEPQSWPISLQLAVSICLNSRFPMFVWWGEHLINIYNDAYAPILGKRHPDAFGRSAPHVWHELWDVLGPQQRAVMEEGRATWNERVLLVMERNGYVEETWFTWSYSPIHREDGRVGGLFCACTEETARVLAERERDGLVREAQSTAATLQAWFDNAPGFVALVRGPDYVFEMVNKAYYQLIGHRDVLGQPLATALPEVAEQGFAQLLDEVRQSGEPFVGKAIQVMLQLRPDAPLSERFLDLVYQPVRNAAGAVVGIFAQGHDVTDQVHATMALRDADRRKDEFIAVLAHELRNPLAPIRQAAWLARGSAPEDVAGRTRLLDMIERQVGQMTLLIDDLLDVSRISQGKLQLRMERAELGRVIDIALESSMPLISAKDHRLEVDVDDRHAALTIDPLRVAQVVSNLLTNAAKYTDRGGRITLTARTSAAQVRITVADTGIGLSSEDQERLFTMFSQVEAALDRSEGGLGIGLALARGLVQLHGGQITASSAGLGHGSEFVITLPRTEAALPEAGSPAAVLTRQEKVVRRLLIADDNIDALESLALLLQAAGHEVVMAADGAEALARAREHRPEIAILDIGMPKLNGYEVARQIRADPALDGTLLVALTGWGNEDDRARALASGFDLHCTKPISVDALTALIATVGRQAADRAT